MYLPTHDPYLTIQDLTANEPPPQCKHQRFQGIPSHRQSNTDVKCSDDDTSKHPDSKKKNMVHQTFKGPSINFRASQTEKKLTGLAGATGCETVRPGWCLKTFSPGLRLLHDDGGNANRQSISLIQKAHFKLYKVNNSQIENVYCFPLTHRDQRSNPRQAHPLRLTLASITPQNKPPFLFPHPPPRH